MKPMPNRVHELLHAAIDIQVTGTEWRFRAYQQKVVTANLTVSCSVWFDVPSDPKTVET